MNYLSTQDFTGNYSIDLSLKSTNPAEGFHVAFMSGTTTGFYFKGYSGYCFDQSGDFFGGYSSGKNVDLKINVFDNRLSYFYNGQLCNNNILVESPINKVEYSVYTQIDGTIKF